MCVIPLHISMCSKFTAIQMYTCDDTLSMFNDPLRTGNGYGYGGTVNNDLDMIRIDNISEQ